MPKGNEDFRTKNMFGHNQPEKGERGYLEPGFRHDAAGNIVDEKGNIYDEAYNLIKEAPSEGFQMAKEQHPDWDKDALAVLAKIYQKQITAKNKKRKK